MSAYRLEYLRLLTARLERLSADSRWARRASGLRGSLIKALEQADSGHPLSPEHLEHLITLSLDILRRAARDIPDADPHRPI